MDAITYENVDRLLVSAVPELSEAREAVLSDSPEGHPGQYIVFGAFDRIIDRMVDSNDREAIRRLFGYFEDMAKSDDLEVANLLQLAVLEHFLTNPDRFGRVWYHMGRVTQASARRLARMRHRENLIPGWIRTLFHRSTV